MKTSNEIIAATMEEIDRDGVIDAKIEMVFLTKLHFAAQKILLEAEEHYDQEHNFRAVRTLRQQAISLREKSQNARDRWNDLAQTFYLTYGKEA